MVRIKMLIVPREVTTLRGGLGEAVPLTQGWLSLRHASGTASLGPLSHPFRPLCLSGSLLLSAAAILENLDSSDVMETPAFPTVMKLLEVTLPFCPPSSFFL